MNLSLSNSFLIAMKRKSYKLTCGMFNLCIKDGGGMHLYSNPSWRKRNKMTILKRKNCYGKCSEEDIFVKDEIVNKWVKPLQGTGFWENLEKTDASMDGNVFIFTPKYADETLYPLAQEIYDSDVSIDEFFKEHRNILICYIVKSVMRVAFVTNEPKAHIIVLEGNLIKNSYMYDPNPGDESQESIDKNTEADKEESIAEFAMLMAIINCMPYVKVEGETINIGNVISSDALTKIYNDTPFDVVVY